MEPRLEPCFAVYFVAGAAPNPSSPRTARSPRVEVMSKCRQPDSRGAFQHVAI